MTPANLTSFNSSFDQFFKPNPVPSLSYQPQSDEYLAVVSRIVHGFTCLIALPFNVVVLFRTIRERSETLHWKPQDNLIFNMALGDTLYSLATLIMSLWYPCSDTTACTTLGYIAYVAANTGIIIPSVMAMNRYSVLRMGQKATNERLASVHDNFTALLSGGVWLWCALMMFPFIATSNISRNLLGGLCGVRVTNHNLWVYWMMMGAVQMLISYPTLLVTNFKLVRLFHKHQSNGRIISKWTVRLGWMSYIMAFHALALPLIQVPVYIVKSLEFHFNIPQWVGHVVFLPYSFNSLINPLLILFLVKQYRDFSFLNSHLSLSPQVPWRRSPKVLTPTRNHTNSPNHTPTPSQTDKLLPTLAETVEPKQAFYFGTILQSDLNFKKKTSSSENLLSVRPDSKTQISSPEIYIKPDVNYPKDPVTGQTKMVNFQFPTTFETGFFRSTKQSLSIQTPLQLQDPSKEFLSLSSDLLTTGMQIKKSCSNPFLAKPSVSEDLISPPNIYVTRDEKFPEDPGPVHQEILHLPFAVTSTKPGMVSSFHLQPFENIYQVPYKPRSNTFSTVSGRVVCKYCFCSRPLEKVAKPGLSSSSSQVQSKSDSHAVLKSLEMREERFQHRRNAVY